MRKLLLSILSCLVAPALIAQPRAYVPGEIVIRFEVGALDTEFVLGDARTTTTPRRYVKDQALDSVMRTVTIIELRKALKALPSDVLSDLRAANNTQSLHDFNSIMVLRVSESTDIVALCDKLKKTTGVSYAEPNWLSGLDDTIPNDTHIDDQHSFYNTMGNYPNGHINASRAWDFTTGSVNVKVGILDSGIDYHHPDLGNGLYGVSGARVMGGYDYVNNDTDPDDDHDDSHGTKVAGIIGAQGNNSLGVAGLAGGRQQGAKSKPGVRLYAFKIASASGTITGVSMANGIVEASVPYYGYGCQILNISAGLGVYSELVRDAIRYANQFGTLVVAAKGNDNTTTAHYPADYDKEWILAVGSSNGDGHRLDGSGGSNYGGGIDVVAPGLEAMIFTTSRLEGVPVPVYDDFKWTSAATPHVAGVAALIKSININLHQNDVEGLIKASADRNQGYPYVNEYYFEVGHGKINAGRALEMMHAPWQLTQHTYTGGTIYSSTPTYQMIFKNNGGGPLSGVYIVKRHTVRIAPGTTPYQNNEFYAWGRSVGTSTGWSDNFTNYQLGFTEVVSKGTQSVTLQTHVYEVWTTGGTYLGWYPTTPGNVVFAYSLVGKPEYIVVINGPDLLEQVQQGTWTASPVNCGSTPTAYRWYRKPFTTSTWTDTGNTTNTYSSTISVNTNLRCDITCGGQLKSGYLNVYYDNGQLLTRSELDAIATPNPFTTALAIKGEPSGIVRITIYDPLGRMVAEKQVDPETSISEIFDVGSWQPGFYFVKTFYNDGRTGQIKLYKER